MALVTAGISTTPAGTSVISSVERDTVLTIALTLASLHGRTRTQTACFTDINRSPNRKPG